MDKQGNPTTGLGNEDPMPMGGPESQLQQSALRGEAGNNTLPVLQKISFRGNHRGEYYR